MKVASLVGLTIAIQVRNIYDFRPAVPIDVGPIPPTDQICLTAPAHRQNSKSNYDCFFYVRCPW